MKKSKSKNIRKLAKSVEFHIVTNYIIIIIILYFQYFNQYLMWLNLKCKKEFINTIFN